MKSFGSASSLVVLALLLAGCGGGAKPATEPQSEDFSASKPSSAAETPAAADKPDSAKTADAKPKPADEGPKPSKSATDILTAPDVVFLFSFNDSEPKQVADEKCGKSAGNDAKKLNACMAAERKKFPADGYRFKQDEKGQWWWITVRQNGNRLAVLHKVAIELGDETATSVTLKPVGKDKGAATVIEVPNDYQIAVKDPKAGRLVFQAKVGVVTE